MDNKRNHWASNLGFLLATAGSAIGLGNLWKFPYMVGQNGGFIFIIISILVVALIGIPTMMGELALGRKTQKNPVGAYKAINRKFAFAGYLGVIIPFIILSYYSVIGGWVLKYIFTYLTGGLHGVDSAVFFAEFVSSPVEPIIWHCLFMGLTMLICYWGINNGIEKASKILMPSLFIIVIVMAVRSVTLPGAFAGLKFLFQPNFEKISDPNVYIGALSQTFYSLSLGMGIIITYGSYMTREENITKSAAIVSGLDFCMALLASVAIMPAVFSAGIEPGQGPSLIFSSLPYVFDRMPFGIIFAVLFFFLVLFAAITSSMSLLECTASYTIDELKWSRRKSVLVLGVLMFLIGIPSSLSQGIMSNVTILGMSFFDFLSFLTDQILLPISAFSLCIFIGTSWKIEQATEELSSGGKFKYRFFMVWKYLITFIVPAAIFVIFVAGLWSTFVK